MVMIHFSRLSALSSSSCLTLQYVQGLHKGVDNRWAADLVCIPLTEAQSDQHLGL